MVCLEFSPGPDPRVAFLSLLQREVKRLVQGYTASCWQSRDLNPGASYWLIQTHIAGLPCAGPQSSALGTGEWGKPKTHASSLQGEISVSGMSAGLVEARRRHCFWDMLVYQGRLPGGEGFWGQALGSMPFLAERNLACFAQRPVEASWGKRAQDTGAEVWGALVLLMAGKRKREPGMIQSHWPEQLSGCRCPYLRCCSGIYSLGNTNPRE